MVEGRANQEASLKKEAERQGQPLVIDKTKEIQTSVYPVYKVTSIGQVVRTDQRTDHLTKLDLNIGRRHYLNPMAA